MEIMAKWRWWFVGWMMVGLMLWIFSPAQAEDLLPKTGAWSMGIKAGYGTSLDNKGVDMIPAHLHIGYTVFNGQWWLVPAGSFEVGIEPFGASYTSLKKKTARGGEEIGLSLPVLTYYFDLGRGIAPYIIAGAGIMYKDLHGYHTGGPFTFMETFGAGVSYFIDKNIAVNAEYRFRHMSNASIYDQNAGLNTGIFLAGFSYYLPNE
jgi:opacity protein-like surface antigen